jgi:hypothetical protein
MKIFLTIAAALLANAMLESKASALTALPPPAAKPFTSVQTVRYHRRGRGYSGLFRHWCAYNCYAVPPCCGPSFYGRYGYSHFAYDEDIPFPHRWDRDASPIDNADAYVYRFTGAPFIRAFERLY